MSASTGTEKMFSRLAGMDVETIFNIDGSGTIDPVVLTRSLKAFDSAVFTDENIEELLRISRPDDNGPIALRVLGGLVESKAAEVPAPAPDASTAEEAPGTPEARPKVLSATDSPSGTEEMILPSTPEGSKSPQAVARLAGMDVLKVLDVNGNGTINKEVLARSLQAFDHMTFTEESIQELVAGVSKPRKDDRPRSAGGGELIYIPDIALYLGAPVLYEFGMGAPSTAGIPRLDLPRPGTAATSICSGASCGWPTARDSEAAFTERSAESLTRETTVRFKIPTVKSADLGGSRGCEIGQPELRGITLKQLQNLVAYVQAHCEKDLWYDQASGRQLTPDRVQLHHLCEWVLRPLTQDGRHHSYVECIANNPEEQMPRWYASWAGGSLLDFVHCLSEHSRCRGFGGKMCYWVSAFASNPWDEEMFTAKSTWQRALEISHGSVQVVGSGPVPFIEVATPQICEEDSFVAGDEESIVA